MPEISCFGFDFTVRILSTKTTTKVPKEEFKEENDRYICSEIGESFQVEVESLHVDGDREKEVAVDLFLDGEYACGCYMYAGVTGKYIWTGHGWPVDDTLTRFKPFEFGAPSEDAKGSSFDDLKIEVKFQEVVETKEKVSLTERSLPNLDHNKVKKPFQPNIGVGETEFYVEPENLSEYCYKYIGDPVVMTIRYTTALGLEIKKLISPATHPQYFPELLNGDDDAATTKLPTATKKPPTTTKKPLKKKAQDEDDVIDLTEVKRVKMEMPPRIDGDGLRGASRDDPIILC